MMFASPHVDRESLITDDDRREFQASVHRKALLANVVSGGRLEVADADALVARDLAIAEAIASHAGLGCTDAYLFDEIDVAMRAGMTATEVEPLAPFFVSNATTARLGRAWDKALAFLGDLWRFLTRPNAFDPND